MVTGGTERLEVIRIPEQFGITFMLHNVVDLELVMNHPTLGAGISGFDEYLCPQLLPVLAIVPAPDETVRALLFLHPRMRGTAPFGDQHTATRGHAELHTYAISVITMPYCACTCFFVRWYASVRVGFAFTSSTMTCPVTTVRY